jgi:hypothetical protein
MFAGHKKLGLNFSRRRQWFHKMFFFFKEFFTTFIHKKKKQRRNWTAHGAPEVEIKQLERAVYICLALLGPETSGVSPLVSLYLVPHTYICKTDACPFVSGSSRVFWTFGAEFLGASSLVGTILNPDDFIGCIIQLSRIFSASGVPWYSLVPPLFYLFWTIF